MAVRPRVTEPMTSDKCLMGEMSISVAVMKAGRIVETGTTADVFAQPAHAYTQALLAAVPRLPDEVA